MGLYSNKDFERAVTLPATKAELILRPPFWRDNARLTHSPALRRLQGKTQLFPGIESDFFRNRLTHSLEVSQIAKSIAMRINATSYLGKRRGDKLDLDLIAFAGLAHDLGHPPFGHNGEMALDECMKDAGGFEGNAQTLRILTKLEKRGPRVEPFSGHKKTDSRVGLNLTYRTLAAVLKYDCEIPIKDKDRPIPGALCKGYYASEASIVKKIKSHVLGIGAKPSKFKTIECQIMDVADDIAYSTYDLEDALKAGFVSPMSIIADTLNRELMGKVTDNINQRTKRKYDISDIVHSLLTLFMESGLFDESSIVSALDVAKTDREKYIYFAWKAVQSYASSSAIASDGYYRSNLTSQLVDRFIKGVECNWDAKSPVFSTVKFSDDIYPLVETLKNYTFIKFIESSRLKVAEYRGYDIVKELFNTLNDGKAKLLPEDFKAMYDKAPTDADRKRVICDFIAGMTDNYAIEFYGRLKSESPQSIFKPFG